MIFPLSNLWLPKVMYSPGYPCCCDVCVNNASLCSHCWGGLGGDSLPGSVIVDVGTAALSNTGNCDDCTSLGGEYTITLSGCGGSKFSLVTCDGCLKTGGHEGFENSSYTMAIHADAVLMPGTFPGKECRWEVWIIGGYTGFVDPPADPLPGDCDCDNFPFAGIKYYSTEECLLEEMEYPITLDKQGSDDWCPECTGNTPATITLDIPP